MVPLNVVLVLFPPVVKLSLPMTAVPLPARLAIVCLLFTMSSTAPPATVTALLGDNVLSMLTFSRPALMVVGPVKVQEPVADRVPEPAFTKLPPDPDMAPVKE